MPNGIRGEPKRLPTGRESHGKRVIRPQTTSRSQIPSNSHRAAIPGKQGPKGK